MRIPAWRAVRLEVRPEPGIGAQGEKEILKAMTSDVSRDGVGLRLDSGKVTIGTTLTISLPIGGRTLNLHARVAWMSEGYGGTRVGLRLHPETADAATRRAFDGFVREAERAFARV